MEVNLNETVRVKLNENGIAILRRNYEAVYKQYRPEMLKKHPFKLPAIDKEGWSEFKLWKLMQEFGSSIYMGCKMPFETTIEIVGK